MAKKKACKICKKLVRGDKCPHHPDAKLVDNWKGRVIILDPEKSEIAKKLEVHEAGEYAIRI
ncbi:DNA-directed RNA polymerase subunit E'' [Candidatus Woesearchaeota archaeon]|nr:DNA-directed RNA polymerase subunit E'' [Candidatus Woesearchaeota archaeon]